MAVVWNADAGVERTRHGYSISPEKVIILPELTGRYENTDVSDLAADIKENGQLEPAVCWKDENGWPVLAAGHRRWRAITEINKGRKQENRMQLEFIYNEAKTPEEAFDYTVMENRNRAEPTPLDNAYNMHIYQTRFGLGEVSIAKKFFPGIKGDEIDKAVKKVRSSLKLLELTPEMQALLKEGKMSTSAAEQIAKLPRMTQEKVARMAEQLSKKSASGNKKQIQVAAVKQAVGEITGRTVPTSQAVANADAIKNATRTPISENTPAKQLDRAKQALEIAGALAYEVLAYLKLFPNHTGSRDLMEEYAKQVAVMNAINFKIPQDAKLDKWAHDNKDLPTVLTGEAKQVAAVA